MKVRVMLIIGVLLLLAACGTNAAGGGKQPSEYGYLSLAGSMMNREAYVDGTFVGVDPADDSNRIRLKVGTHLVVIRSSNRVLLSAKILIEPGEILEVTVP